MSKRTFLAALASVALLAACDKSKEDEIVSVSFSSFGFYAKDNADVLKSDYIEESFNSDAISFTLPYGTDPEALKTLVPEFAVTEGASVNVADASGAPDGKDIVSGSTPIDCSSDVQLFVFLKNNYKAYKLSVKIAEPAKWSKVAETALVVKADPVLAVNPKDGVPYVAGSSPNADGVAEPHLFKLDGAELKDVAGALVNVASDLFAMDICPDGTPYVSFYNKAVKKQCVMKISGSEAEYVGDAAALYKTGSGSNSSVGLFAFSASDIWCAQRNDDRDVNVARRALNLAHYDGSTWTNAIPISGRNVNDYAYCVLGKYVANVPYLLVFNQNTNSISLYKYASNAWSAVFESLKLKKADGAADAKLNLRALDFDIASGGDIYVMIGADYSVEDLYNLGVVRIAAKDNSQTLIGGELSIDIDKSRSASMGLDNNDVPYLVYTKPEGDVKYACITHIDAKSKTWSTEEKLSPNPSDFVVLRYDDKGRGYIVSSETIGESKKYVLYSSAE